VTLVESLEHLFAPELLCVVPRRGLARPIRKNKQTGTLRVSTLSLVVHRIVRCADEKPRTVKPGWVRKIIKPIHPRLPEQAEIEIHDAHHLYREIRINNELEDENGHKVKLKEHAEVKVVVEAEPKDTTPANEEESKTKAAES
jgi:hypothetical protein